MQDREIDQRLVPAVGKAGKVVRRDELISKERIALGSNSVRGQSTNAAAWRMPRAHADISSRTAQYALVILAGSLRNKERDGPRRTAACFTWIACSALAGVGAAKSFEQVDQRSASVLLR